MTSLGRVREWHDEDGWGVIDSEVTPGGCWAHLSSLLVTAPRALRAGQEVTFSFETADQDGYSFGALEAWPAGREPIRPEASGPSSAYRSSLALTFDDEAGAGAS